MTIEELKTSVTTEIGRHSTQLRELALKIHANPEPGFHEVKAAGWLADYLPIRCLCWRKHKQCQSSSVTLSNR